MNAAQPRKILLLAGALLFAACGQFYFARRPDYFWDALVFYAVGILLFLAAVRVPGSRAPVTTGRARLTPGLLLRSVPVAAGLLLGLLAVLQLLEPRDDYWPIFWTWVSGSLLYLLGFARRPVWSWAAAGPAVRAASAGAGLRLARPGLPAILRSWAVGAAPALASGGGPAIAAQPSARPAPARALAGPVARVALLEWGLVALLVAAALALRAWHIDTIPWTLGGDEGNFGLFARSVLAGDVRNMFVTGHLSMPTMYSFFQAGWLRLAGDNTVGLRLPWAVLGALSVLGTYLLVRRLFGRNLALLTAFLLATYHYHIHYSRLGVNNISDPLFISWSLYFLVLAWQGKRRWAWAASGMIAGLAFYSYTGSRLVPVILLAVLAWAAFTQREFLARNRYDLLAMLGGFLVVFGPMGLFALQHPDDFNARINQIGILQSGWLERAALATGQNQASLLLDQLRRAFLAFNLYLDRSDFYKPGIPLLDFASSVLFVLGFAYALARLSARRATEDGPAAMRYAIFVFWFILAVVLGGALTESPPSSQRIIATSVPVVLFVALAVRELTRVLRDALAWSEDLRELAAGILALALAFISLHYYFVTYQQSWVYGSPNAEIATRIGYYLRDAAAPPAGPVQEYFFGAPRLYADFGSIPFIARDAALHDVAEPLTAPLAPLDPAIRPVFVFLPERAGELQWVQQTYPHGALQEIHRLDDPAQPLLFVVYRPD